MRHRCGQTVLTILLQYGRRMTSCPGRRFHPITCVCNPPSSFASFSTKHHSICQLAGPRLRTNRQRFRYHQLSSYFIRASVPAGIALLVTELSPPAALLIGWLPASSYCRRWWWQSSRSRNERLLVLLAWQSPPPSRSPAASGLRLVTKRATAAANAEHAEHTAVAADGTRSSRRVAQAV